MFKKFLKKLFKTKRPPREKEKLVLKNVGTWLNNRGKNIHAKEDSLYDAIDGRVKDLISELDEKLIVLNDVDYESLKADPRLKAMVSGNLRKYISHINLLQENVSNLDEKTLGIFFSEAKSILNDFFKKSQINYQKTAILVRKELADVHKSVTTFSKFLDKTMKSNKEIIDASRTLSSIEQKVSQINEIEKNIDEIEKTIISLKVKKQKRTEDVTKLIEKIKKVKRSKSYIENMKKVDELRQNKKDLEKEIHELRGLIDFKTLGNKIHSNNKEMNVLRAHKDNFKESFSKDNGAAISRLLTEAGMGEEFSEKMRHIKKLKTKTSTVSYTDDTHKLLAKQKSLQIEINELKNNVATERKLQEKLRERRENTIDSMIKEFAELDVILRR